MAVDRTQIINLLRERGPLVPNEIKRALGGDILIFGAVLSELKSRGLVDITQVKKGGSSFYYAPELREHVATLIEFLNPKDQVTVRRLQQEKVLNEANEELFTRVSFRNIPDFAKPFMMQTPQGEYRFWRYYLVGEQEARQLVQQQFQPAPAPTPQLTQEVTSKITSEVESVVETSPEPTVVSDSTPSQSPVTVEEPKEKEELQEEELQKEKEPTPVVQPSPVSPKQEEMLTMKPTDKKEEPAPAAIAKQPSIPEQKPISLKLHPTDTQQHLIITPQLEKNPFYTSLVEYFAENEISLHAEEQLSKDREYTFIVTVPTAVGPLRMYAHGRNKKKLNEGDVAPALLKSKSLDLPCLFLHSGEFTKKSLQLIKKEYKGIILKEIKS